MRSFAFLLPLAGFAMAAPLAVPMANAADNPKSHGQQRASDDAYIPFANHGGVWNWQADGDSAVYFEDLHHQWYKATLLMPAFDLPFVETIGIDSRPDGTLDKWGAVLVHGQRYPFASFEKVSGPPPRHGKRGKVAPAKPPAEARPRG